MVFFKPQTLEIQLTAEELEKLRLRQIEQSEPWKKHAAMHGNAGLDPAQLHVSGEAVLGENADSLRARFGLKGAAPVEQRKDLVVPDTGSYGPNVHKAGEHIAYTGANQGNRPGLWATCNCGAEFKLEQGKEGPEVKTYGVVGTDTTATGYATSAKQTSPSYTAQEGITNYKPSEDASNSYA